MTSAGTTGPGVPASRAPGDVPGAAPGGTGPVAVPAQLDPGAAQAPQRRKDLPRCSDTARERCDPLGATAAPALRWLLVEHRGPWAPDALAGSGIDTGVREALVTAARSAGGRVLLVRRPSRGSGAPDPDDADADHGTARRWAVCDQRTGRTRWGTWTRDEDLRAAAAAMSEPVKDLPATDEHTGPLLLVCAHGRHDACCAVRGRPVAAALARRWPASTWECSHVGGDRFAANVVVVPDGAYYGDLDPASAVDVVEAHLAGATDVRHLRGVSTGPPAVQAAVIAVLDRFGPAHVRHARAGRPRAVGEDRWEVVVEGTGPLPARSVVTVARARRPPARLTCRAPADAPATVHEAVDVRVEG